MSRVKVTLRGKQTYYLGEPIKVTLVISNTTGETWHLLGNGMAADKLDRNCFTITRNGVKIPYDGWYVKREAISAESYIYLHPEKDLEIEVNLAENYDMSQEGAYTISLNNPLFLKKNPENPESAHVSEEINTSWNINVMKKGEAVKTIGQLERERSARLQADEACVSENGGVKYPEIEFAFPEEVGNDTKDAEVYYDNKYGKGFSEKFRLSTKRAFACMCTYLEQCVGELDKLPEDEKSKNLHHIMFFGEYQEERFHKTEEVMQKVKEKLKEELHFVYKGETDDDTGGPKTIAYTTCGSNYVYFCKAYTECQITGEDSKMGAIFHELTHAAADTDDMAYGREDSRQLARDNPDEAVINADSYEYFMETVFLNRMDETEWEGVSDIGTFEYGGPSLVLYGKTEQPWIFYTGKEGAVYSAQYDAESNKTLQPSAVTDTNQKAVLAKNHPQAIVWKECLYLFFIDKEKDTLKYTKYNSSGKWDEPVTVMAKSSGGQSGEKCVEIKPKSTPVPAGYREELHFAYCMENDNGIYWLHGTEEDGFTLESCCVDGPLLGSYKYNPASCVYKNKLYLFYQREETDKKENAGLQYAVYDSADETYAFRTYNARDDLQVELDTISDTMPAEGRIVTNSVYEKKGELRAVNAGQSIYLIFCDRSKRGDVIRKNRNTRQIQISNCALTGKQLVWTDFEQVYRSSEENLSLGQYGTCELAGSGSVNYMVCQKPDGAGIYLSRQMRV